MIAFNQVWHAQLYFDSSIHFNRLWRLW